MRQTRRGGLDGGCLIRRRRPRGVMGRKCSVVRADGDPGAAKVGSVGYPDLSFRLGGGPGPAERFKDV